MASVSRHPRSTAFELRSWEVPFLPEEEADRMTSIHTRNDKNDSTSTQSTAIIIASSTATAYVTENTANTISLTSPAIERKVNSDFKRQQRSASVAPVPAASEQAAHVQCSFARTTQNRNQRATWGINCARRRLMAWMGQPSRRHPSTGSLLDCT